jgi:hypothetical protein
MLITQPALICLETTWHRLLGRAVFDEPEMRPLTPDDPDVAVVPATASATEEVAMVAAAQSLPAINTPEVVAPVDESGAGPLTANERRARAAALRALALSRGRRFASAQSAFAEAARLDPNLDLTRIPGFWRLERAAHEAAIDAYDEAGRTRDAAVLRAQVRSTFRPKPVRAPQIATLATVKQ